MSQYAYGLRPATGGAIDAAQARQAASAAGARPDAIAARGPGNAKSAGQIGAVECQTCKSRKYQDGSNDPGVSFKTPGHIDPGNSSSVVRGHEQEHVSHERSKALSEDRKVVSQTVRLFTSVCPECGRVYVSGGVTRTVTASAVNQTQGSPYRTEGSPRGQSLHVTV
jgi:hypothetical protein